MNLQRLVRRWRRLQWLAIGLRATGWALATAALAWTLLPPGPLRVGLIWVVAWIAAAASVGLPRPPMADRALMATYLDRALPEMEDSSDLLAREDSTLSGLQALQAERIRAIAAELSGSALWPRSQIVASTRVLLVGAAVALLVIVGQHRRGEEIAMTPGADSRPSSTDRSSPQALKWVRVEIRPPTYTGQHGWEQELLDLEVPEGSLVRWRLPDAMGRASLEFVGREPLFFEAREGELMLELEAWEEGVYRLLYGDGGQRSGSEYASFSVLADRAPQLRIVRPRQRVTRLAAGESRLGLQLEAVDDHGLAEIDLWVTLARGAGELVEFRQARQPIGTLTGERQVSLDASLNLSDLAAEPDSELYFFAEARDHREPEANVGRSATFIVHNRGERVASTDLGAGLPIIVPPEYFRSQRQIILDTEKLIAEEETLTDREFGRRSEDLGLDQRALRMRYGTLLGEEFESGRPVAAGDQEDSEHEGEHLHDGIEDDGEGNLEPPTPSSGVPEEFVHSHDSAEIATFFTSETRGLLREVLAQMWEAEGQLRIHRPREALPFEYRALEWLKELQQRSRIYVQKVGFETPPLEPEEIRFRGELGEIGDRVRNVERRAAEPLAEAVGDLLGRLQDGGSPPGAGGDEAASRVRAAIARQAGRDPAGLTALTALDRWMASEGLSEAERRSLVAALWRLTPEPKATPGWPQTATDSLSELYRTGLSREDQP